MTIDIKNNENVISAADKARDHFIDARLNYDCIGTIEWYKLKWYLKQELTGFPFNRDGSGMIIDEKHSYFLPNDVGGTELSEIKVNSCYFSNRQGITFERDGWIGFAGWAATENEVPFTNAFHKWVDDLRPKNHTSIKYWSMAVEYLGDNNG